MPRTPKVTDGEAPKKRARKTTSETDAGTKVVNATTAAPKAAKSKSAKPEVVATPAVKEVFTMISLEERIRARAYELYLRRGGHGGSPEQDWFQAAAEVYGESVA